jgi:20S proteasome alpha/beta subunit
VTLIVGILCKDGVVLASDSAATFGAGAMHTIGQQEVRKIVAVNKHILYSGTGAVGASQIIADRVRDLWENERKIKGTAEQCMNVVGQEINTLMRPYLETAAWQRNIVGEANQSLCKSLIAMPTPKQPSLLSFDFNGAPERATAQLPFVSMGSGQFIADPFLAFLKRVLWGRDEPTLAEGRLVAIWTIDHVRRTNAGGVAGEIQVASLVAKGGNLPEVEVLSPEDTQEHLQRVASAEGALVAELRNVKPAEAAAIPQPPQQ